MHAPTVEFEQQAGGIVSAFDIEQRWPELFQNLDEQQRLGVRNTLAALWHEGFELTREDFENLTDYAAGIIDADEYRVRAYATAGARRQSEETL